MTEGYPNEVEFGFYPLELSISVNGLNIRTLPGLEEIVAALKASNHVDDGWIYPQKQITHLMGGGIKERPYAARVFGLNKTHAITYKGADSFSHIDFLVWALSFFVGQRLTTTEAGFCDATPIKPGTLVDFIFLTSQIAKAIILADDFWKSNVGINNNTKLMVAAIHALFWSENPRFFQFERLNWSYAAIDTCYKIATTYYNPPKRLRHAERINWMSQVFSIPTPSAPSDIFLDMVEMRNNMIHETLFMNEPLGFKAHLPENNQVLHLEMKSFVCRLLVALFGAPDAPYVKTPINLYQPVALELP